LRRAALFLFCVLPLALVAGSARAIPSQMTWIDTGQSNGGPISFTADPPLCPSGTVRDVGGIVGIKMQHTCADGSGTFEFASSAGKFEFTAGGTGRYVTLRGTGSCSLSNPGGTFTRSCHALADFDNTPPTVSVKPLDIVLTRRGLGLHVSFTTTDNVAENAVKYRVSVAAAGHALGHTAGTTAGGAVRASVRGRLPKAARRITVSIRAVDPLGNARTVVRSARIRR
jgi:hypothetical protein